MSVNKPLSYEEALHPTREEIQRGVKPDISDQRYARAANFANQVMSILYDYLPANREYHRIAHRYVMDLALKHNWQIIEVPAEWDALTKLQIETEMLKRHPAFIEHPLGK